MQFTSVFLAASLTATVFGQLVSQISDGQIQGTTGTTSSAAVVTSSSAAVVTTSSVSVVTLVSQISDGQIQATSAANSTVSIATQTGAGNRVAPGIAAAVGVAALLI